MTVISRRRTITESDVVSFAALSGDWHPLHTDAEWAARSEFGERVAHGMLVLSCAIGLLPFDPERVVALREVEDVTFKRPVRIGDTIRVESSVEAERELGDEHSLVTLRWRILNQRDELVIRARMVILERMPGSAEHGAGVASVNGSSTAAAEELRDIYAGQLCL